MVLSKAGAARRGALYGLAKIDLLNNRLPEQERYDARGLAHARNA